MQKLIKRGFDIAVALALGVVLSPVLLALYFLVKSRLGAPVFFTQTRIGMGEKPFTLIKFRTMRDGAGSDAERLTPFGKMLRATSLDELPELWNILTGDMSIVGPRPLLPEYLPYYTEEEKQRHAMRPGITGLAQVCGRNATTWEDRLRYDREYVRDFSLMSDLWILWRTVIVVLKREGISADGHVTMPRFDDYRKGTQ
ncbi:MAG: sugar transferase [Alphaproteobacteria bacterium]|nr:sugar transferase [Alphaproteobacteria bacterium]